MFESASVLDGLNDEQRAAVAHPGGPLLVLAGAGTGKTRTLVARAAWLCEQGVPPSRILLLTFTRRAADDMLSRAIACARPVNGRAPGGRVTGGTFHAIAHRIIRQHAESFSLPPEFTVIDPAARARPGGHAAPRAAGGGVRRHLHPVREHPADGRRGGAWWVSLVHRVHRPAQ
jgi:hypothetical protein